MIPCRITATAWLDASGFGFRRERGEGETACATRQWQEAASPADAPVPWHDFPWRMVSVSDNPRFRRHDTISRLALSAVELLGADLAGRPDDRRESVAVIMATAGGCVATDAEFWRRRVAEGTASPAAFIYTLPSMALGVIAIHYGLRGPSSCLILDAVESGSLVREAAELIGKGATDVCICVFAEASEVSPEFAALTEPLGTPATRACALLIERSDVGRFAAPVPGDLFDFCRRRQDAGATETF